MVITSSLVLLSHLLTQLDFTSTLSGKLLHLTNGSTTADLSSLLFSTSLSVSMHIWAVSGNYPIVWACVLGSVLLTVLLLPLLLQSSLYILSVKVPSLMQCLLESQERSTTCWSSKPSTISSCTRSICLEWLVYLVAASFLLCMAVWSRAAWFVRQLKQNHKTMATSLAKKKKHIIS